MPVKVTSLREQLMWIICSRLVLWLRHNVPRPIVPLLKEEPEILNCACSEAAWVKFLRDKLSYKDSQRLLYGCFSDTYFNISLDSLGIAIFRLLRVLDEIWVWFWVMENKKICVTYWKSIGCADLSAEREGFFWTFNNRSLSFTNCQSHFDKPRK